MSSSSYTSCTGCRISRRTFWLQEYLKALYLFSTYVDQWGTIKAVSPEFVSPTFQSPCRMALCLLSRALHRNVSCHRDVCSVLDCLAVLMAAAFALLQSSTVLDCAALS